MLKFTWNADVVQAILSLPLGDQDIRWWQSEPAGTCSFKALYKHLLPRHEGPSLPWRLIWKMDIPSKLQMFRYRLLLNKLPTRSTLARWSLSIDPLCPICRQDEETVDHIFAQSSFAKKVWDLIPGSVQKPHNTTLISFWFWNLASTANRRLGITLCWTCWYLWKNWWTLFR